MRDVTMFSHRDLSDLGERMTTRRCTLVHNRAGAITVSYGAGDYIVLDDVLNGPCRMGREDLERARRGAKDLDAVKALNMAKAQWEPRLEAVLTALLNDEASMRQHDHVVDWLDEFGYFATGSKPGEIKRLMLAWDYHTGFVRPWLRIVYGEELESAIEAAREA